MGQGMVERKRSALAWGIFLGVSWTWCIGMFLPVLLVRDLGPAAFMVFALPNVIGAAGMGWVLERQGLSEGWVAQHRVACIAFSIVTILFHIFFAGWVISLLLGLSGGILVIFLAVMLWVIGRHERSRDVTAAMMIYLISLACVGLFLTFGAPGLPGMADHLDGLTAKLFSLTPVCFFGFALCPYLDLTFHRARQQLDSRRAKLAFGTGFGLFFFSMILFTLIYSGPIADRLAGYAIGVSALIVGAHMFTQAGFTISAHLREIWPADRGNTSRLLLFAAAAIGIIAGVWFLTKTHPLSGELPYLLFMAFYGLIFPAYVWTALAGRGKVNSRVFAAGILIAAPFYYVGFVERRMLWLLPGLAIAILAGPFSARSLRRQAA